MSDKMRIVGVPYLQGYTEVYQAIQAANIPISTIAYVELEPIISVLPRIHESEQGKTRLFVATIDGDYQQITTLEGPINYDPRQTKEQ